MPAPGVREVMYSSMTIIPLLKTSTTIVVIQKLIKARPTSPTQMETKTSRMACLRGDLWSHPTVPAIKIGAKTNFNILELCSDIQEGVHKNPNNVNKMPVSGSTFKSQVMG